jgi:hypothetical protein
MRTEEGPLGACEIQLTTTMSATTPAAIDTGIFQPGRRGAGEGGGAAGDACVQMFSVGWVIVPPAAP